MSKEKAGGELQRVFWRASGGVWQRVVTALVLGIKCDCGVVNGTMEMWLDRWYNHLLAFAFILLLNLFSLSLSLSLSLSCYASNCFCTLR